MSKVAGIIAEMKNNPNGVRFSDLKKVCEHHFGEGRQVGGSHRIYKTPWAGDPRVNIQEGKGGKAKGYQVKQILEAIAKLEVQRGSSG